MQLYLVSVLSVLALAERSVVGNTVKNPLNSLIATHLVDSLLHLSTSDVGKCVEGIHNTSVCGQYQDNMTGCKD
jgi:hypothetical protein